MLVIVGMRTDEHSSRSHVGNIGSKTACLLEQLKRILEISDYVACLKEQKSVDVAGGEGKCGDIIVESANRERRSSGILSVKKEAKRSASEVGDVAVDRVMRTCGEVAY